MDVEIELFGEWLQGVETSVGPHRSVVFCEIPERRADILTPLRSLIRSNYEATEITARRVEQLGEAAAAALLREKLPSGHRARSGDLGEILAAHYVTTGLGYIVPVLRLRWKDGRETALRGDDVFAIRVKGDGAAWVLKGEAKSRASLHPSTIKEAASELDRDEGRPSRHTVAFVADRLRTAGNDELALVLETLLVRSFEGAKVEHLLFTLSGNEPGALFSAHLQLCSGMPLRHAVGVVVSDHAAFVTVVYDGI